MDNIATLEQKLIEAQDRLSRSTGYGINDTQKHIKRLEKQIAKEKRKNNYVGGR